MTHICVGKLTIIGSDNGLSPGRRQAIIWTNDGILLIGPLGTNFSEILIEIHTFSFKKMHLKMSSWKWRPFCLGLNVLISDQRQCPPYGCYFWLQFVCSNSLITLPSNVIINEVVTSLPIHGDSWGPFCSHYLSLIWVWKNSQTPSKVWDEVTYSFQNFNGCTVEVWEWLSNFIPYFIMDVITYPCWDWS